jgi:hypothetical protein
MPCVLLAVTVLQFSKSITWLGISDRSKYKSTKSVVVLRREKVRGLEKGFESQRECLQETIQ